MQRLNYLRIPHSLYRAVIAHCRQEAPKEACGLVAGKSGKALCVLPMPNVAANPERHFLVDREEQQSAFRFMAEKGWELLCIYHSHPTAPPIPSTGDIAQAYYHSALYLIVGLRVPTQPDVRLYRFVKQTRRMVAVRLIVQQPGQPKRSHNRESIGYILWGCSLR